MSTFFDDFAINFVKTVYEKENERNKTMTNERKIHARQVPPEHQSSPLDYGDAPEHVYIFGNRAFHGIRADEIDEIRRALENIAEEYDDITAGRLYNENLHAIIWYHLPRPSGKGYSRTERIEIVQLAQQYADEPHATTTAALDAVCAVLEILHGMQFDCYTIRGCCQGDWQYCIMQDEYGKAYRDKIETAYFNTGEEWEIDDGEDEYTIYTYNDARQEIADAIECDPADIVLYRVAGYRTEPIYQEVK